MDGMAKFRGTTRSDTISGTDAADAINGRGGGDWVAGGGGNDTLRGGAGSDTFVLNAPLSAKTNVDTITDFNPAEDAILLDHAVFAKLTANGALDASMFHVGAAAGRCERLHRL